VLQFREVEKPVPKVNDSLRMIHPAAAPIGNTRIRKSSPFALRFLFGLMRPRNALVLGKAFAGEFEAVSNDLNDFR
jgi:hypothetical protein